MEIIRGGFMIVILAHKEAEKDLILTKISVQFSNDVFLLMKYESH